MENTFHNRAILRTILSAMNMTGHNPHNMGLRRWDPSVTADDLETLCIMLAADIPDTDWSRVECLTMSGIGYAFSYARPVRTQ